MRAPPRLPTAHPALPPPLTQPANGQLPRPQVNQPPHEAGHGHAAAVQRHYRTNATSTTKYNVFTFLPKSLFEQYRRVRAGSLRSVCPAFCVSSAHVRLLFLTLCTLLAGAAPLTAHLPHPPAVTSVQSMHHVSHDAKNHLNQTSLPLASQVANVYFTITAGLSLTPYSPVRAWTTFVPLGIVLGTSIIKEGIEDYKRYKNDKEVNNRRVQVRRRRLRQCDRIFPVAWGY